MQEVQQRRSDWQIAGSEARMTFEFEMTPEDWVAFNLYHHHRSPTACRRCLWS